MASKDIEKAGSKELESPLAPITASLMEDEVSATDVVLPRIYLQNAMSDGVRNGVTVEGDLIIGYGSDDPAPTFLIGGPDKRESFVAYVIGREKFAATTSGGGMFFHPDKKRDMSDPESWEGWFFDLAVPEFEASLPVKWMLWKTAGAPAARQINTLIERKRHAGDPTPVCIKVTVVQRTGGKGHKYPAPQVAPSSGLPSDAPVVNAIAEVAVNLRSSRAVENDAPAVDQPSFS